MSKKRKHTDAEPSVALRADQVQRMYGLTAGFLRKHPEIPRFRAGHRTVLFRRSDIEAFLERRRIA
jgi:hypothetical protein